MEKGETIKLGRNAWQVGEYTIDAKNPIGKGSYGIIYTATNGKGEKVVAKRIDLTQTDKAEKVTKHLDKLVHLNHPNILKIYHVISDETLIWIFMEYCPRGDLRTFCQKRKLSRNQQIEIMIQMTEGLDYLHKNNIIHRDIKPANILVADGDPFTVKLTDFDLSKFLGDVYDTSEMSSNVGTAAFKAPEFFIRKIVYHREVDIFSTGITFLALIQGNKNLIPYLETARDEFELNHSIGATLAVRLRYGVQPLRVVTVDQVPSLTSKLIGFLTGSLRLSASNEYDTTEKADKKLELKKLVCKMTSINPEDRPTAQEVLKSLRSIYVPEKKLDMTDTWRTNMACISMYVNQRNELVLRGRQPMFGGNATFGKKRIVVCNRRTGDVLYECQSSCGHHSRINELPSNPDCVLEACSECNIIKMYNLSGGQVAKAVHKGGNPWRICDGPNDSVLVLGEEGKLLQLIWNEEKRALEIVHSINTYTKTASGICWVGKYGILTVAFELEVGLWCVQGLSLKDGRVTWKFTGNMEGRIIRQIPVCADSAGLVYIGHDSGNRVFVLNGETGKLKQILELGTPPIWKISWTVTKPNITVHHDMDSISCF